MARSLVVLFALLLAGCPQGSSSSSSSSSSGRAASSAEGPARGGESPDAVFARARQAAKDGQWRDYYACLSPKAAEELLGGMIFGGAVLAARKSKAEEDRYKALLATHGVHPVEGQADPNDALRALARQADDPPACLEAVMSWLATQSADFVQQLQRPMTLADVQVDGDRATGAVTLTEAGAGREVERWAFVRQDGVWLLDGDAK